jgi:hypothetical protein
VPADVVEVLAAGVESQIENIEDVVDNVNDQLELAEKATGALVQLVQSMRKEIANARPRTTK